MATEFSENNTEGESQVVRSADLSLTTCIVVEDQKPILFLICDVLRTMQVGHILSASSVEEAKILIDGIENNPNSVGVSHVDFMIVDWNLTGMAFQKQNSDPSESNVSDTPDLRDIDEGVGFVRWVRQNKFTHFAPVLGISAYSSTSVVDEMRRSGVNGFVSKPFTVSEIARQVQHIVQDIRPYLITPSGYFGPERRRQKRTVEVDKRRSQGGVKSFAPPRSLRLKTANTVELEQKSVKQLLQQMQELAPPDFLETVQHNLEQIESQLDSIEPSPIDETALVESARQYDEINYLCNEILSYSGCFTYQMIAEAVSGISRFIGDKYFIPKAHAHSLIKQQIAMAKVVCIKKLKGPSYGEMQELFSASLTVMEKVLRANRKEVLRLK